MPTDKQSVSLTERRIRDAKPGAKTYLLRDRDVVGLCVRVPPGGTKAFCLDYRANGRRRLATLARVGEISLKDAREMAGREKVAIRAGKADPVRDRQAGGRLPRPWPMGSTVSLARKRRAGSRTG